MPAAAAPVECGALDGILKDLPGRVDLGGAAGGLLGSVPIRMPLYNLPEVCRLDLLDVCRRINL